MSQHDCANIDQCKADALGRQLSHLHPSAPVVTRSLAVGRINTYAVFAEDIRMISSARGLAALLPTGVSGM